MPVVGLYVLQRYLSFTALNFCHLNKICTIKSFRYMIRTNKKKFNFHYSLTKHIEIFFKLTVKLRT